MSRIGKKPIQVPQGVKVTIEGQNVQVEGVKGRLDAQMRADLLVTLENGLVQVAPKDSDEILKSTRAMWGTMARSINNMIEGVTKGYEKKLVIEGVGYRASVLGNMLTAEVGYTNPTLLKIPEGVSARVEKNVIVIQGIDKQAVGQFASQVRALRKVEPYKGKGIRYETEIVKRKLGKRAAATGAAGGA